MVVAVETWLHAGTATGPSYASLHFGLQHSGCTHFGNQSTGKLPHQHFANLKRDPKSSTVIYMKDPHSCSMLAWQSVAGDGCDPGG